MNYSGYFASGQHVQGTTTSARSSSAAGYSFPPAASLPSHATTADSTAAGRPSRGPERHNFTGHLTLNDGVAIDSTLHELPQKPYNDGIDAKKDAAKRIDYRPYGFTVGRVLSKDFSEIFNPNGVVDGWKEKEKASFHVEFCDATFGHCFREQRRVRKGVLGHPTRETFATFVAERMREMLESPEFARFPYALNEIRVVSIDVRSRGSLQPRVFVDDFAVAVEQLNISLGVPWIQEVRNLRIVE